MYIWYISLPSHSSVRAACAGAARKTTPLTKLKRLKTAAATAGPAPTAAEAGTRVELIHTGWADRPDGARFRVNYDTGWDFVFGKYAGTEIKIEGTQHQIMHERDILAVLEEA